MTRFRRLQGEPLPPETDGKKRIVNPITRGPSVFWAIGPADQTQHLFYASTHGRPWADYACKNAPRKATDLEIPDEKSGILPHKRCMEIRGEWGYPPPRNVAAYVAEQRDGSEDAFYVAVLGPGGRRIS